MTNKTLLLLAALVTAVLVPAGLCGAVSSPGRWTVYPTLGFNITKALETPHYLYAVSNGKLFSRDLDTDEVRVYSTAAKLSDSDISNIFYNKEGKYLLIAYVNGNLDMLYDDGRVVNLPEIKDAVISSGHGVNSADFADGRIYLATDFGMAVYDDSKHEIVDSGIYNTKASNIFSMGDHIALVVGDWMYVSPKNVRHHSFDSFTRIRGFWSTDVQPVSENALAYNHPSGLCITHIDFGNMTSTLNMCGFKPTDGTLQRLDDGTVFGYNADKIFIIDSNGLRSSMDIPAVLAGSPLYASSGLESVWGTGTDGIGRYDLSDGDATVLMQPFRSDALTINMAVGFSWSADGNRLYLVHRTPAQFIFNDDVDNTNGPQGVNIFEPATGLVRDVTVPRFDPAGYSATMAAKQQRAGWPGLVGGPSRVVEDPDDSEVWYQAYNYEPFFAFRGNEVTGCFNAQNTGYTGNSRGYNVEIDPVGNLWLCLGHRDAPDPTYLVLPADKRRGDLSKITKDDFIPLAYPGFSATRETKVLFCKHSHYMFITAGGWADAFVVVDTKGTYSDFSDDTYMVHRTFTDTDGRTLDIRRVPFPVEDHRGQIWFCSDIGPLVLQRPALGVTSDMAFRRPIVPRNDGTNFGDYLLDGTKVTSIAVDHSNRKWMATETDGVYLVNEDGTEIISHFTASNSPLSSNNVHFVTCDPHSNKVYMGCNDAFYEYDSDSSPAAEDYSDVYAYPNPVRPDYTGWITIAGLKDNSLVKIADIAGNVFFQGRSEGGMISWDGCNSAGERVRTGVYFVFASESGDGTSSGAVAKIMVVN